MLISIIIPTRERARYLRQSLATALAIQDDQIEIIVSDNASTDETKDVVASFDDRRIRYLHTGRRVSMRTNFEFAFQHASGEYLISFGDDDGIVPGQFPLLRKLLETRQPDGASWALPTYGWPVDGYGTKVGGIRFMAQDCFGEPERVTERTAVELLQSGHLNRFFRLPRIYHGAMSRKFLDRIKDSDGILFRARSPDIYASFRAVLVGGVFDYYAHPFSINGHSPARTGGSKIAVRERRKGGPADRRFLTEAESDPIEDIVPITLSMALAFLGTAQTAAAVNPSMAFNPEYKNWYRAALRDMRRKEPDVAQAINESLTAHSRQFGTMHHLDAARSSRGMDWPTLFKRLSNAVGKLRKKDSIRLSATERGENTILTAARMCDVFLGNDMALVLTGATSHAEAWKTAIARSGAYARQI